jgi:hypothetical protein
VTIYAKLRAWGMHPRGRGDRLSDDPASSRISSQGVPASRAPDEAPGSAPSTKRSPGER